MTLLNDMPELAAADVRTDQPTRNAKLKWVVIVDRELPPGPAANAVACLSASVGRAVPNLVGPGGLDASGGHHRGLPWLGCTILAASPEELRTIRTRAVSRDDLYVVDIAEPARSTPTVRIRRRRTWQPSSAASTNVHRVVSNCGEDFSGLQPRKVFATIGQKPVNVLVAVAADWVP